METKSTAMVGKASYHTTPHHTTPHRHGRKGLLASIAGEINVNVADT
jgi:hypothetical protein